MSKVKELKTGITESERETLQRAVTEFQLARNNLQTVEQQLESAKQQVQQAQGAYNFTVSLLKEKYSLGDTDQIDLQTGNISRNE